MSFWKTVADRVRNDEEFAAALVSEAGGKIETVADYEDSRSLLRDLTDEVAGTEDERLLVVIDALSAAVEKYEKSKREAISSDLEDNEDLEHAKLSLDAASSKKNLADIRKDLAIDIYRGTLKGQTTMTTDDIMDVTRQRDNEK